MSAAIALERVRDCWSRAASFPADKENVYPQHAEAQEFEKNRGARVLEYGCGGGSDALSYLRRSCDVTFVDIVPGNVSAAKERIAAAGYASTSRGLVIDESDRIPLPSGLFDVASAHGVLHHIPDPLPVLRELRRLLKPRGKLYVMLYTEQLFEVHRAEVDRLVAEKGISQAEAFGWRTDDTGTPYAVHYTEQSGTLLLEAAGFRVHDSVLFNADQFRTFRAEAT